MTGKPIPVACFFTPSLYRYSTLENYAYDSTAYLVLVLGFAAQGIQQGSVANILIGHKDLSSRHN